MPKQKSGRTVFSALTVFFGFALTIVQIFQHSFTKTTAASVDVTVRSIGEELLALDKNGYALPFEVVSMLLLAAMIGCIVIAMRTSAEIKKSDSIAQEKINVIQMDEKVFLIENETGGLA